MAYAKTLLGEVQEVIKSLEQFDDYWRAHAQVFYVAGWLRHHGLPHEAAHASAVGLIKPGRELLLSIYKKLRPLVDIAVASGIDARCSILFVEGKSTCVETPNVINEFRALESAVIQHGMDEQKRAPTPEASIGQIAKARFEARDRWLRPMLEVALGKVKAAPAIAAQATEIAGKPCVEDADGNGLSLEERTLGLIQEHPGWTAKQFAEAVGVCRQHLYRMPMVKTALQARREIGREHRRELQRRQAG